MKGNGEVVNRNPEMGLFHFVTGFAVGGYTGLYLAKNYRITGDNFTTDMSNTTFFTPIPIPNISKEALTIPNTNTNFLMSP